MSREPPFAITGIVKLSAIFRMASAQKVNAKIKTTFIRPTKNSTNLYYLHVAAVRFSFVHVRQLHLFRLLRTL